MRSSTKQNVVFDLTGLLYSLNIGGSATVLTRMLYKCTCSFRYTDTTILSKTVEQIHVDIYNTTTQINDGFDCVSLAVEPSPTICLYPDDEDVYISKEIRHGGIWDREILTKAFQDILRNDPGLGFIDIGANIGLYSLVSAAMGHNVIAVEPFDANLRRLGKAINLGECKGWNTLALFVRPDKTRPDYSKSNQTPSDNSVSTTPTDTDCATVDANVTS